MSEINPGLTADVYRCTACGFIDRFDIVNDRVRCPECNAYKAVMYMQRPSSSQLAIWRRVGTLSGDELEDRLTEIDPDWRQRFGNDPDRAREFYK